VISSTSIDKRTKSNEHSKSSSFHDKAYPTFNLYLFIYYIMFYLFL